MVEIFQISVKNFYLIEKWENSQFKVYVLLLRWLLTCK